jgi:hypothetical protein
MRRLLLVGVVVAAVAGTGSAQAQDVYDNPALGSLGPLLRETDRLLRETDQMLMNNMTPQQRQEYQDCMAQGFGHPNCMFIAQHNQMMRTFDRERAEVDRLAAGCYQGGDQRACEQLDRLMASIQDRAARAELQTRAAEHRSRVQRETRETQQRIWDREAASRHRMQGWRYENAAKEAYARGDRWRANELWYRAEQEYARARQYQPQ